MESQCCSGMVLGGMKWWVTSCSSSWCIKRCFSWISSLFPSPGTTALSVWSQRNSGSVVGTGHRLGEDKDGSLFLMSPWSWDGVDLSSCLTTGCGSCTEMCPQGDKERLE